MDFARIAVVGVVLGALSMLWQRAGKPWCDRVSDAQHYPRLTRIGLVILLYGSAIGVLGVLAFMADAIQRR